MAPEALFSQLRLCLPYVLMLTLFASILSCRYLHQCFGSGSVFRSFLDPDPYSEYGSRTSDFRNHAKKMCD